MFASYINVPAVTEETLSCCSQSHMPTLHRDSLCFVCIKSVLWVLIYFATLNNRRGKKKREVIQNQGIESKFNLETGVRSDGGGERTAPRTGSTEGKTLVKNQQRL